MNEIIVAQQPIHFIPNKAGNEIVVKQGDNKQSGGKNHLAERIRIRSAR